MHPAPLVLAIALAAAGLAMGGSASGAAPLAEGAVPAAPPGPAPAPGPGATEMIIVLKPGDVQPFRIVADGGPLTILVRLNNGASLGGTLDGPSDCPSDDFSTNVIALSTSGQVVGRVQCDAAAGPLEFSIHSSASAFVGTVELQGAVFQVP